MLIIDWEKQHEQVSKLLELEHDKVKKSSPLRLNHSLETSESSDSVYDKSSGNSRNGGGRAFLQSSDEEEEVSYVMFYLVVLLKLVFLYHEYSWIY